MFEWLTALFNAITGVSKAVEKGLPNDELKQKKFELEEETLRVVEIQKIANKHNRLADEMFGDLRKHPKLNISDKVNFEAAIMDEKERDVLIKILTDRLNADPIYNRIKNKKSKFKL